MEDQAGQAGLGVGRAVGAVAEVPGTGRRGEQAVPGADHSLAPCHGVHRAAHSGRAGAGRGG